MDMTRSLRCYILYETVQVNMTRSLPCYILCENGANKSMTRSPRCYILHENGADEHDQISEVSYVLWKRCRWTWIHHWGVIYFLKTVQMNMTRSTRCHTLWENGADNITEVLYTLCKRCRWTWQDQWQDQWGVINFVKTMRLNMTRSVKCDMFYENGADEIWQDQWIYHIRYEDCVDERDKKLRPLHCKLGHSVETATMKISPRTLQTTCRWRQARWGANCSTITTTMKMRSPEG